MSLKEYLLQKKIFNWQFSSAEIWVSATEETEPDSLSTLLLGKEDVVFVGGFIIWKIFNFWFINESWIKVK